MAVRAAVQHPVAVPYLPEPTRSGPQLQLKSSVRGFFEGPAYYVASLVSPSRIPIASVQSWMQNCAQYNRAAKFVEALSINPREAFELAQDPKLDPNTVFDGKTLLQHAYEKLNPHVMALLLMKRETNVPNTAADMLQAVMGWQIPEAAPGDALKVKSEIAKQLLNRGLLLGSETVNALVPFALSQGDSVFLSAIFNDKRMPISPDQATEFLESLVNPSTITNPVKAQMAKALLVRGATVTAATKQSLSECGLLNELQTIYQAVLSSNAPDDLAFIFGLAGNNCIETRALVTSSQTSLPATRNAAETAETFAKKYLPGDLANALPDNWFRDFFWTGLAAYNVNLKGQVMPALNTAAPLSSQVTSSAFVQPMLSQWAYSTVPMAMIAAAQTYLAYKKGEATKEELIKVWAPVAAASLAIPMWDLGQVIGTSLGSNAFPHSAQWFGSSIAGGMIAAPFTGIFEGFTQWAVRYLVDVATNPVTREMWRQDPALMGKVMTKELLLNVTIGAIPGAVWQIVWFFALTALAASLPFTWAVILTMLAVATSVMICNFACTHAINKASDFIDRKLGWDEDIKRLRESAERGLQIQKLRSLNSANSSPAAQSPQLAHAS